MFATKSFKLFWKYRKDTDTGFRLSLPVTHEVETVLILRSPRYSLIQFIPLASVVITKKALQHQALFCQNAPGQTCYNEFVYFKKEIHVDLIQQQTRIQVWTAAAKQMGRQIPPKKCCESRGQDQPKCLLGNENRINYVDQGATRLQVARNKNPRSAARADRDPIVDYFGLEGISSKGLYFWFQANKVSCRYCEIGYYMLPDHLCSRKRKPEFLWFKALCTWPASISKTYLYWRKVWTEKWIK